VEAGGPRSDRRCRRSAAHCLRAHPAGRRAAAPEVEGATLACEEARESPRQALAGPRDRATRRERWPDDGHRRSEAAAAGVFGWCCGENERDWRQFFGAQIDACCVDAHAGCVSRRWRAEAGAGRKEAQGWGERRSRAAALGRSVQTLLLFLLSLLSLSPSHARRPRRARRPHGGRVRHAGRQCVCGCGRVGECAAQHTRRVRERNSFLQPLSSSLALQRPLARPQQQVHARDLRPTRASPRQQGACDARRSPPAPV